MSESFVWTEGGIDFTYSVAKKKPISNDPDGVFANDQIDLSEIEVYGFDYDYTLATYKTNVEELIHNVAKNFMVEELKVRSCQHYRPY